MVPDALADATSFLKNKPDTQAHFERVSDLVEGFESPFGFGLLSTVHWIATKEPVQSVDDIVARTYGWNERKKQFSRRQIEIAVRVLSRRRWIDNVGVPRTL